MRKIIASLLAAVSMGGLMAISAAPAHAGHFDGNCESGEACLYETSTLQGAVADFSSNVFDYSIWTFYGTNNPLNDRAGSVRNSGRVFTLRVYEHARSAGRTLAQLKPGNVQAIERAASSHYFL
jgi:hypothetical protein